ncbi:PREDICTED: probable 4-coumarate--CoA ligase 3 [Vollenhovia emeryi]|uniref:probable 4-coumarate--CoA ligase 3 n=1 Tax=Vollenhovia emeryi TaxID=411798 RepID=UPI0005F50A02|nr:PREDICTED: probable 4-coumarate--CoA ligase 3 [Vollenhovia emeryi]
MEKVQLNMQSRIVPSESRTKEPYGSQYPPPCKIVDNVIIGDEGPLFKECLGYGELLFAKLNGNPDLVGQIDPVTEKRTTFAEMRERSVRCALWLKSRGVEHGDVVGISTNNHPDCAIPLLGCLFVCAHFYPMHHELNIHDSRYFLSLGKPKVVFVNIDMVETMARAAEEENLTIDFVTFGHVKGFQSFEEIIREQNPAAVDEFRCTRISSLEETALFSLSSGSTGPSKATLMSHRALINNMFYDVTYATEDQKILLWFSTLRWITGTLLILRAVYFCKTRIICDRYDNELACKLIEKYNVEFVWFQPRLMANILKNGLLEKYRLPSLKRLALGGAPMKLHLLETLKEALPHTEILFLYGMSELCGISAGQRRGDKMGSVGYVVKNTQLKVIDVDTGEKLGPNKIGELLWKSPYIMTGYYNNPEATKKAVKDGWLHSGDFGYYDEDGEIFIRDRIMDTIRINGLMVYPAEIENVLHKHPALREVVVVGIPDDIVEEYPFAFVSKASGAEVTAEELMKLVADNLESYKHLRGVQFLDKFPYTETGKIARMQLKEMAKRFVSDCVPA